MLVTSPVPSKVQSSLLMIVAELVKEPPGALTAEALLVEADLDAVIDGNHDRIPRVHVSGGDLHVGDDPFRPLAAREADKRVLGRDDPIPERQDGFGVVERRAPGTEGTVKITFRPASSAQGPGRRRFLDLQSSGVVTPS